VLAQIGWGINLKKTLTYIGPGTQQKYLYFYTPMAGGVRAGSHGREPQERARGSQKRKGGEQQTRQRGGVSIVLADAKTKTEPNERYHQEKGRKCSLERVRFALKDLCGRGGAEP